jgi:hypothetical protein
MTCPPHSYWRAILVGVAAADGIALGCGTLGVDGQLKVEIGLIEVCDANR